jgi:hypothetical protein
MRNALMLESDMRTKAEVPHAGFGFGHFRGVGLGVGAWGIVPHALMQARGTARGFGGSGLKPRFQGA